MHALDPLFDALPWAIAAVDRSGAVAAANRAWVIACGSGPLAGDAHGCPCHPAAPDLDGPAVRRCRVQRIELPADSALAALLVHEEIDTPTRELARVEQDLRLHLDIFRHIQLGLLVWRRDDGRGGGFRLVTANPAAAALTGRELDTLVGADLLKVFPPREGIDVAGALADRLLATDRGEADLPGWRGDMPRIFSMKSFALPERLVGLTFDDVTERRGMEERLRQAEKMETVGRLAGGLAHDFNNVLTTIITAASMLDEELAPGDPRREEVRDIIDAARRGAGMARRLLDFSRREPAEPRRLDLNETVGGLQHLLRRLVGPTVELTMDLDRTLPAIVGDPVEIEQVVLNLAVNARQAMGGGGRLTIRTAFATPPRTPRAWVTLHVTDTGSGMDAATRARMFEPFFTTRKEGTGLGLATVYAIVTARGGSIEVESSPGAGTTFVIRFPAAAEALAPVA